MDGLLFTLGVLLVILKMVGVITWPWVWVLAPFWIPLVIVGVVALLAIVFTLLVSIFIS